MRSNPPGRFTKALARLDVKVAPEQIAALQKTIDLVQQQFNLGVARGRGVSISRVESWATGQVFVGQEGVRMGLVDAVGSIESVLAGLQKSQPAAPAPMPAATPRAPSSVRGRIDIARRRKSATHSTCW